ncbi:hypothetical protein HK103_005083 [Boothiomyces macroporosus]|uniref:Uncharacterized protein n=1 Tax=Boothiomyces macroporosus TaxID=261099 RepID=A0AAD5UJW5_9FUNG|nr:hypothetical protein HK103_005083 [Boothiomyces macroporosus]
MDSDSGNQFPAGNQSFQQAFQQFPNQQFTNNPMMLSQVQSFPQQPHNMMGQFVQQQPMIQINPQSDQMVQLQQNGMPFNGVSQFSPQMMPNQAQLSGQNTQFRPAGSDWRTNLSATDRHHVIGQLGRAVQQALPPTYHTPERVDNLARSVEQHIYETADSRIRGGQFPDPSMQGLQPGSPAVGNQPNLVSGSPNVQQNSPNFLMQGGNQASHNQPQAKSKLSNEASADIHQNSNMNSNADSLFGQNSFGFELDMMSNENSQSSANSMNINPTQAQSNTPSFTQSNLKQSVQPQTPAQTPPSQPTSPTKAINSSAANNQIAKSEQNTKNADGNNNTENAEGNTGQQHEVPTVIGGMKVTLLNLTEAEKHSVSAKMEQIRPTYMRIDGLISTLLKQGGEKEFDKVRKLTGMKQMLGAQLEVLHQDIFFIRPDTLQALLPSLQQYFHYAELLVSRTGGQNANLQGNAANPRPANPNANFAAMNNMQMPGMGSPVVNSSIMGQPGMAAQSRSPMVAQNQMNQMMGSPNVRPGMMVSPQVRPNIPPGQGRGMVNQQAMTATRMQQIQLLHAKNQQLSQQLVQIQQLMQSQGIAHEQMQSLNQKQQECLRQQQSIQQQLMTLNSSPMPNPNFNRAPMRPLRPDASGNMSPEMRVPMQPGQNRMGPQMNQMYQTQMMGMNPQMMNMQNPQFNQFQARPQNMGMVMQQQAMQMQLQQNPQMADQQGMFMQQQVGQGSPQLPKSSLPNQGKTSPVVTQNTAAANKSTKVKKEQTPKISPNTPKISTPNMPQGIPPQNIQGNMNEIHGMSQSSQLQGMQQNQMQGMQQNMMQQPGALQSMQGQGLQTGMNGMPGSQAMQAATNLQQQVMMNKMQNQSGSPMNQPAAMMQMRPGMPANMTPMQQQAMAQMAQRTQMNNAQRNQFNSMPNQAQQNLQMSAQNPSFQQNQPGFPPRMQQADARSPPSNQFNLPLNASNPRPPAPTPAPAATQPASTDDWFNDFPAMPETIKKEEPTENGNYLFILGDFDQDFFNFDYVPPSSQKSLKLETENLDELLESHVNETSNSNKRQRDDFDDFFQDSEKKPKFHSSLESELKSISSEHNLTYTLNNTPNDTASIKFTFKNTAFQITVKSKSVYEKGSGKGLISFSTAQSPDNLSKIVSEYVSPSSTKRVSDIVQVIVSALEN